MKCKIKNISSFVLIIFIEVLLFAFVVLPRFCNVIFAESTATQYSNVLDDLEKDDSFSMDYYPEVSFENSPGNTDSEKKNNYARLNLIQIAESVNDELFVYVYQPSGKTLDLRANYISLSTEPQQNIEPMIYNLRFLNSYETVYKYVVEDFTVSSEGTRYYTIVEIFRAFDRNYDNDVDNDNTINSVSYKVEKQYAFSELNGKPYVSVTDIETIEITDKYVGFCRYPDGFYLYSDGACDAHFVAFSTDRKIDDLREADVYYEYQEYYYQFSPYGGGETNHFGEIQQCSEPVCLTGQNVTYTGGGLWAGTYEWKEIQSVSDFINTEERNDVYEHGLFNVTIETKLTKETLEQNLSGKQWVLRFLSTEYSHVGTSSLVRTDYTIVQSVSILRLKFVTDGIMYNLGVVDNMQSGDNVPDNEVSISIDSELDKIILLLFLLLGIVLLIVFLSTFSSFIKGLVWLLLLPFKVLFFILSLPFKAVSSIKKHNNKNKRSQK